MGTLPLLAEGPQLISLNARGAGTERALVCPGDSGGPAFVSGPNGLEVVGVISASNHNMTSLRTSADFQRLADMGSLSSDFVRVDLPEIQAWILGVSETPRSRFETTRIGAGRR